MYSTSSPLEEERRCFSIVSAPACSSPQIIATWPFLDLLLSFWALPHWHSTAFLSPAEERRLGSGGPPPPQRLSARTRLSWPQSSTCGASVTGKDGSVALARVLWAKGKTKQLAQFSAFEHFLWGCLEWALGRKGDVGGG